MRDHIAKLVGALRLRGVPVSVAEAIDAASAATVVGVERPVLADALAAALVKDECDRGVFSECFAAVFPARAPVPVTGRRRRASAAPARGGEGGAGSGGDPGATDGSTGSAGATMGQSARGGAEAGPDDDSRGRVRAPGAEARARIHEAATRDAAARAAVDAEEEARATWGRADRREHDDRDDGGGASAVRRRDADGVESPPGAGSAAAARARALRTLPFAAMSPRDVEEAAALVRTLARRLATRLRRRLRPRRRGRLDFRRTLRAATPHGGVPLLRHYRGRRPRPPALVALCDLSVSAATATDFFLALLAPATAYFARVRLFGFVDRLVEIEFVDGCVRPAGPIDLMARSDFGRVLCDLATMGAADLARDAVLLVLGDARNNRRPPRADLLRDVRARVRRVVWLNPEPVPGWNTGDSVMASYARYADAVVACGSLGELADAVAAVARG